MSGRSVSRTLSSVTWEHLSLLSHRSPSTYLCWMVMMMRRRQLCEKGSSQWSKMRSAMPLASGHFTVFVIMKGVGRVYGEEGTGGARASLLYKPLFINFSSTVLLSDCSRFSLSIFIGHPARDRPLWLSIANHNFCAFGHYRTFSEMALCLSTQTINHSFIVEYIDNLCAISSGLP